MEFAIYAANRFGFTRTGSYPYRRYEPKTVPTFATKAEAEAKLAEIKSNERANKYYRFEIRDITPKDEIRDECQICSGSWVIKKGRTSLHGYTRPGHGWLEGECMGAKALPYSKSCDVLKRYLSSVVLYQERLTETRRQWFAGEIVKTMHYSRKWNSRSNKYEGVSTEISIDTPADQLKDLGFYEDNGHFSYRGSWKAVIKDRVKKIDAELEAVAAEIVRVEKRIADWKLVG